MNVNHDPPNGIRKWWTVLLWMSLTCLFLNGCADNKPQKHRVGIICGADFFLSVVDGFKAKMTDMGYVEGENVIYDLQAFNNDPGGIVQAAKKLVADKVDLIVTMPTNPSFAAQAAARGTQIPVIFVYAGVKGTDLVDSVRKPGRNTTGVRYPGPDQIAKRLNLLLEFAPHVKRVWVGYDKNYHNTGPVLKLLRPVAISKGVTLVEVAAVTLDDLRADLAKRSNAADLGIDAIILMADIFNHSPEGWSLINAFATEHQVPIGGSFLYTVEQGAIFGNANNLFKVGEMAAPLAMKVFNGTPAGTIPVSTPEGELYINYKVARELGLTVSDGLLNMAVKIIR